MLKRTVLILTACSALSAFIASLLISTSPVTRPASPLLARESASLAQRPDGAVLATIPASDPSSLEDAVNRLEKGASPLATDLRFLLLDDSTFPVAFGAYITDASVTADGLIDPSALDPENSAGLTAPEGYGRVWERPNGSWALRQEVVLLDSVKDAEVYATRLSASHRDLGAVVMPASTVQFAADYSLPSAGTPRCVSYAHTTVDRLVLSTTITHADCGVTLSSWAISTTADAANRAEFALKKGAAK